MHITIHAADLHRRISACRWCLTRGDFKTFRLRVLDAIDKQEIVPTQLDDFEPSDSQCGPNMYTVNEQLIKPITLAAGGMSWALMLHPDGLKCDLFVSHAWQEGVFELVDNLLNAWEYSLKHAWCCAFANPQNLDIATLISNPRSSPFAIALGSASHVVVVTNSTGSIYTRLWCVYEAYLAYQSDKTILVAYAPIRGTVLASLPYYCLFCGVAYGLGMPVLALGFSHDLFNAQRLFSIVCLLWIASLASSLLSIPSRWWKITNYFGMTLLGFWWKIGMHVGNPFLHQLVDNVCACDASGDFKHNERTDTPYALLAFFMFIDFLLTFVLSEVDRIRYDALDSVASQLRHGYTGSVRDARCTSPSDQTSIFSAISNEIREVDQTVQVLMRSGMSTQRLRQAESLGMKMEATRWRAAPTFLLFSLYFVNEVIALVCCRRWTQRVVLQMLINLLPLVWAGVYFNLRIDGRAFAMLVTNKLAMLRLLVQLVLHVADGNSFMKTSVFAHTSTVLSIIIAIAGIDGITRIPACGRTLAILLVGQSLQEVTDSLAEPSGSDESADEEEASSQSGDSE